MPPGEEFITTHTHITNKSQDVVTLRAVSLRGSEGVGDVIELVRAEAVPPGLPGGTFKTYPPGFGAKKRCEIVRSVALDGYVVGPGEGVRILLWLRARSPGRYHFLGPHIVYEQDASLRSETVEVGMEGTVAEGAPPMLYLARQDPACLEDPRVRKLPTLDADAP